jgi:hypothetical protein
MARVGLDAGKSSEQFLGAFVVARRILERREPDRPIDRSSAGTLGR